MAPAKKKRRHICSAISCHNYKDNYLENVPNNGRQSVKLFKFPRNPTRAKRWVHLSGCQHLEEKAHKLFNSHYFCSNHFKDEAFVGGCYGTEAKLTTDATPTLFDIPNPPPRFGSSRKHPKRRTALVVADGDKAKSMEGCPNLTTSGE